MKQALLGLVMVVSFACGGSKPAPQQAPAGGDPVSTPMPEGGSPDESGSAAGSDAIPAAGTCEAAGGRCMHVTAAIACATKPQGTCPADHFCCGL